jgi:hypothetical protein
MLAYLVVLSLGMALATTSAAQEASPANGPSASPAVVVHPAPEGEPLSDDFQVTVGSHKVPVYPCRVSAMPFNQLWPGYQRPLDQTELASFASWDMAGPVEVEVVSRRPVESVAIRPIARGIQAKVEGNRIRFQLKSPCQITVEVNGWHHALHLFANPPETNAPKPNDPGVRYFGPGVHRPGKITLESNQTLFLAGGAVVYGAVEARKATNVRVLGRGILDVSGFERKDVPGGISMFNSNNVVIDGVTVRNPNLWCVDLFCCSKINISNIKLIGLWRYNSDGIDLCNSQDATVRNCFVRSFDDSLVVKGLAPAKWLVKGAGTTDLPIRNILFEGCVVWNDWGRALEIGAETVAPEISNVVFRDCDVIRTAEIAMDVQHGDRAAIKDVLFDNIRVEVDDVNFAPTIQNGRDAKFVPNADFCPKLLVLIIYKCMWSQDAKRGTMQGVTVRNCTVSGKPLPPSHLQGYDAQHAVRDVTIDNLRINGQAVRNLEDAKVWVGAHVENLRVVAP